MSDASIHAFLDDVIERGEASAESFRALPDASPIVVTPQDRAAAAKAIDAAVARLGCPRPALRFVYCEGRARGQCEQLRDGSVIITLNLSELRTLSELAEVTYHEMQHCADFHSDAWSRYSRAERERRANTFARSMLRGGSSDAVVAADDVEAPDDDDARAGDADETARVDSEDVSVDGGRLEPTDRPPSIGLGGVGAAPRLRDSPSTLVSSDEVRASLRGVMDEIRRLRRRLVHGAIPKIVEDSYERQRVQGNVAVALGRLERQVEGELMCLLRRQ
jgi:hypothetical protein